MRSRSFLTHPGVDIDPWVFFCNFEYLSLDGSYINFHPFQRDDLSANDYLTHYYFPPYAPGWSSARLVLVLPPPPW